MDVFVAVAFFVGALVFVFCLNRWFMKKSCEGLEKTFRLLANDLFDEKMQRFQSESKEGLENVLNPLKDNLGRFQQDFNDKVIRQNEKKVELKKEMELLRELNTTLSHETKALTEALSGKVKYQGNWGEMILERILESAGLKEGRDYVCQGRGRALKTDDGHVRRPDVIVNLPGDKHLIIDSKVTLNPYLKAIECPEDKEAQKVAIDHFIKAIKTHITGLGGKEYEKLPSLETPDFVMMFMPIEGAYALALEKDSDILDFAWKNRVSLVGPASLLATMKTVGLLWKQEKQNKNVLEIAQQGGKLYDKFVGLVDDLQDIGKNLGKTQDSYQSAFNKLQSGKGNLIGQAEKMKELGAKATKSLSLR